MINAEKMPGDRDTTGNFARWVGLLLAPSAWAVQLQSLWLTSEYGCVDGNFGWNHVVSLTALMFSVIGGIVAWNNIPAAGAYAATKEKGTPSVRKRFMGYIGVALSVGFVILIIAQWLPTLLEVPCHK